MAATFDERDNSHKLVIVRGGPSNKPAKFWKVGLGMLIEQSDGQQYVEQVPFRSSALASIKFDEIIFTDERGFRFDPDANGSNLTMTGWTPGYNVDPIR